MKHTTFKKMTALLLCLVLASAAVLTGCGKAAEPAETAAPAAETEAAAAEAVETEAGDEQTVLGEGAVSFQLVVKDLEDKETHYEIHTDKKTVGEALLEQELVEGTVGEWGLMIDTVNGIKLDFAKDGMYWGFFIDGEYAQTGVDATEITEGVVYSLIPSK